MITTTTSTAVLVLQHKDDDNKADHKNNNDNYDHHNVAWIKQVGLTKRKTSQQTQLQQPSLMKHASPIDRILSGC